MFFGVPRAAPARAVSRIDALLHATGALPSAPGGFDIHAVAATCRNAPGSGAVATAH